MPTNTIQLNHLLGIVLLQHFHVSGISFCVELSPGAGERHVTPARIPGGSLGALHPVHNTVPACIWLAAASYCNARIVTQIVQVRHTALLALLQ
jgi:hypothetical protein